MKNNTIAQALTELDNNIVAFLEELSITYSSLAEEDDRIIDVERRNVRRILNETTFRLADVIEYCQSANNQKIEEIAQKGMNIPGLR